ncbi:hypothetical protein ACQ4M3_39745 [Leptolyngbya sp. AN03gr2]
MCQLAQYADMPNSIQLSNSKFWHSEFTVADGLALRLAQKQDLET